MNILLIKYFIIEKILAWGHCFGNELQLKFPGNLILNYEGTGGMYL